MATKRKRAGRDFPILLATSPGGGRAFRTATFTEQIADMTATLVDGVLAAVRAATVAELAELREDAIDRAIVERRLRALDAGTSRLVPWEDVKRQLGIKPPKKRKAGHK